MKEGPRAFSTKEHLQICVQYPLSTKSHAQGLLNLSLILYFHLFISSLCYQLDEIFIGIEFNLSHPMLGPFIVFSFKALYLSLRKTNDRLNEIIFQGLLENFLLQGLSLLVIGSLE